MATKRPDPPTDDEPSTAVDDKTLGGALPDPADDSPRGKFNRGEISYDELQAFYRDESGRERVNPDAR